MQLIQAQSIWMNPRKDRYLWLEILTPNYNGKDRFSFTSSTSFLSVRYPIWKKLFKIRTVAELSFAHTEVENPFYEFDLRTFRYIYASGTDNVFGNPYLGIEVGTSGNYDEKDAFVFGELGFRLPVVTDSQKYGKQFGTLCDIDRSEAFNDSVTTITGRVNYVDRATSGFGLRIRVGPTLFISGETEDDLYLDQAIMITFEKNIVWAGVAFTARTLVTGPWFTWSSLTEDQLGFSAYLKAGRLQPGLHFRVLLDDNLSYNLQYVFGLSLGLQFP